MLRRTSTTSTENDEEQRLIRHFRSNNVVDCFPIGSLINLGSFVLNRPFIGLFNQEHRFETSDVNVGSLVRELGHQERRLRRGQRRVVPKVQVEGTEQPMFSKDFRNI